MVAEELFFGETSSGVAADLQAATNAACQMVGSLGMGSTLISAAALEMPGGANIVSKVLATDAGRDEVEELLRRAKAEAREMVESNRHVVETLRDTLLEREELIGSQILEVIASARTLVADAPMSDGYPESPLGAGAPVHGAEEEPDPPRVQAAYQVHRDGLPTGRTGQS
jgi:hypothetical protein